MSRSVSSREVRLRDHDELDWTLPACRVNPASVSREMSRGDGEKEARRNI